MTRLLTALAVLLTFALATPANAKHHHYRQRHHHKHVPSRAIDANGNYAAVHTKEGLVSRVIVSAQDKFQGFIDAIEDAGYKISDFGCLSSGHMRHSKHHWGGACDFDQRSRSKTAPFMYHVTEIARRFGLVDGCTWHPADCGHIEVPGSNIARRNPSYKTAIASR